MYTHTHKHTHIHTHKESAGQEPSRFMFFPGVQSLEDSRFTSSHQMFLTSLQTLGTSGCKVFLAGSVGREEGLRFPEIRVSLVLQISNCSLGRR